MNVLSLPLHLASGEGDDHLLKILHLLAQAVNLGPRYCVSAIQLPDARLIVGAHLRSFEEVEHMRRDLVTQMPHSSWMSFTSDSMSSFISGGMSLTSSDFSPRTSLSRRSTRAVNILSVIAERIVVFAACISSAECSSRALPYFGMITSRSLSSFATKSSSSVIRCVLVLSLIGTPTFSCSRMRVRDPCGSILLRHPRASESHED